MDILHLLELLNNPLNTMNINIVNNDDVVDKVMKLAPVVTGLLALAFSYYTIKSQVEATKLSAKIQINVGLKKDWLDSVRKSSSEYLSLVREFGLCRLRVEQAENEWKRNPFIDRVVNDYFSQANETSALYVKVKTQESILKTYASGDYLAAIESLSEYVKRNLKPDDYSKLVNECAAFETKSIEYIQEQWDKIINHDK